MKIVFVALALSLAGCGAAVVNASPVPPPLPAERVPLPPVSDDPLVWQPGDWVVAGDSYRYDQGRYVRLAGHGTRWMFGHWAGDRGHYVWVPGGWI